MEKKKSKNKKKKVIPFETVQKLIKEEKKQEETEIILTKNGEQSDDLIQTNNPSIVQNVIAAKNGADENTTDKTVLAFDVKSGDLKIMNKKTNNDNDIVVDQIYRDGFFANNNSQRKQI